MGTAWVRIGVLTVGVACLVLWPVAVRAGEVVHSFAALQGRVLIGETITATDRAGTVTKGRLVSLTAWELTLDTPGGPRTLPGNELTKVQARRSGPLWNGALIGALVPLVPLSIVAGKYGCEGCAPWVAAYTAIGAGVGVGIDALVKGNVTVMKTEDGERKGVRLAPMIAKGRKGVLCSVRF